MGDATQLTMSTMTSSLCLVTQLLLGFSPQFALGDQFGHMNEFEEVSLEVARRVEAGFRASNYENRKCSVEHLQGYDMCASSMPHGRCNDEFGATAGCNCTGRNVDSDIFTAKAPGNYVGANEAALATMNALCAVGSERGGGELLSYIKTKASASESEMKWVYLGTEEGVLVNYPGFLWGDSADADSSGRCGHSYDPRQRPWYVAGATGPKDVVIVLDQSGSMAESNRMTNAKLAAQQVVSALTASDYVNVIRYSTYAQSENNYLVPASKMYRERISQWIGTTEPNGGTYYVRAMEKAFSVTERSDQDGVSSNCSRIYVFLSDGEPTDDIGAFTALINRKKRPQDMFFFVGLGSGISSNTLKNAACAVNGVFSSVPDNNEMALRSALEGYYKYLALGNAIGRENVTRWSEPFDSIPSIWGPITTAVTPIFDKTKDPWSLVGVSAVDVPICSLEQAAAQAGIVDDFVPDDAPKMTKTGCECVGSSYSWEGQSFTGCTTADYSVPWCATKRNLDGSKCGVCNLEGIGGSETNGCWDECLQPGTVRTKVESELKRRTSSKCYVVTPDSLGPCALESLRGAGNTCGADCNSETIQWNSILNTANPYRISTDGRTWAEDPFSGRGVTSRSACGSINDATTCPRSCADGLLPVCSKLECISSQQHGTRSEADYCSSCGCLVVDPSTGQERYSTDQNDGDSNVSGAMVAAVVVAIVVIASLAYVFHRRTHTTFEKRNNAARARMQNVNGTQMQAVPTAPPPPMYAPQTQYIVQQPGNAQQGFIPTAIPTATPVQNTVTTL